VNVSAALAQKLWTSYTIIKSSVLASFTDILAIAGSFIAEINYSSAKAFAWLKLTRL
jgi:hypothetical protein